MPEYIEREALTKTLKHRVDGQKHHISDGVNMALSLIEDYVKAIPTADVVEVVRCKDCEHWGGVIYGFVCRNFSGIETKICMHADDFCSCGKRKEVKDA